MSGAVVQSVDLIYLMLLLYVSAWVSHLSPRRDAARFQGSFQPKRGSSRRGSAKEPPTLAGFPLMAFDLLLLFFLHSLTSVSHTRVRLSCQMKNAAHWMILPVVGGSQTDIQGSHLWGELQSYCSSLCLVMTCHFLFDWEGEKKKIKFLLSL